MIFLMINARNHFFTRKKLFPDGPVNMQMNEQLHMR
jgi:hypothetical protein